MKLLFLTNGFPPHRWAGTETYTAALAQQLQERGHEVRVVCVGKWEEGDRHWSGYEDTQSEGVRVRRLNLNWTRVSNPFRNLYDNPATATHIESFLRDEYPADLVHVTSCETLSASVLWKVRELGLPLALTLTDFWFLCPRINLLHASGDNCDGQTTAWECLRCKLWDEKAYRWPRSILPEKAVAGILTLASRSAWISRQPGLRGMAGDMAERKSFLKQSLTCPGALITASWFVRDIYVANGVTAPIEVLPYGHDLSWVDRYTGRTPSSLVRFGFMGQVIESKGLHLLLEAARRLLERLGPRFKLVVYGDLNQAPAYAEGLREQAARLPNVEFRGAFRHEDIGQALAGFDVLVVPSLWYDFPLVIQEAFAVGTPIIATDLGGMAEAVRHDVNGLLFERGDIAGLAQRMERIVTEKGLIERLSQGVPKVMTITEHTDRIEGIYSELIRTAPRQATTLSGLGPAGRRTS